MPIVIPAITAGIGAVGNWLGNRKSDKQNAAEQAQASGIQQQQALSKTLADYSQRQYALTQPALQKAVGLYSTLASGNRSAIQGEIAPQVASIAEGYRGANKRLEQAGVRGGVRDTAIAESARSEAGQVGMLPFLARQNAMGNLAQLGMQGTGQAISGLGGAAGVSGVATGQAGAMGQQQFNQGQVVGQQVAGFGGNLMQMMIPYLLDRNKNKPSAAAPAGGGYSGSNPWSGEES